VTTAELLAKICEKYPEAAAYRTTIEAAITYVCAQLPDGMSEEAYLQGVMAALPDLPKKDEEPGGS